MSALGARVRELRRSAGLTQEQLAEKSGVSRDTIAKLEQGIRSTARTSTLALLAGPLGVEPRVLIGKAGESRELEAMAAEIAELRAQVKALTQVVAFAVLARAEGEQA